MKIAKCGKPFTEGELFSSFQKFDRMHRRPSGILTLANLAPFEKRLDTPALDEVYHKCKKPQLPGGPFYVPTNVKIKPTPLRDSMCSALVCSSLFHAPTHRKCTVNPQMQGSHRFMHQTLQTGLESFQLSPTANITGHIFRSGIICLLQLLC